MVPLEPVTADYGMMEFPCMTRWVVVSRWVCGAAVSIRGGGSEVLGSTVLASSRCMTMVLSYIPPYLHLYRAFSCQPLPANKEISMSWKVFTREVE